ncbi:kinase [uncultured Mailhella sp.]|uniref:GHMP family kinase ATP-binding protein n=1 Tax=uncultured Mailhella sp. TaxID=1981031 RepID=UPI002624882B|nr:kinase [uncultured Mailhella sp.]
MIITRTPYRISFFGGGTDYHAWYEEHGGDILSTTINHYNYISCRYLPPFNPEYQNRIAWKILEYPNTVEEIQHNAIRAVLQHYGMTRGVEISNQCDLPARSGLGSSSSFCAGLIKAVYALKGEMISKYALARETIHLEREILKENGGIQDQIATVYGGLNHIHINANGSFSVDPLILHEERRAALNSSLLLFFTGISRTSSEIAEKQAKSTGEKTKQLGRMQELVAEASHILTDSSTDLDDFGRMLHETWTLKRSLTDRISNSLIDDIYQAALDSGALGGKLLGAGGGGFILFYVPEEHRRDVKKALRNLIHVPFKFDDQGCQIVMYAPKDYPQSVYEKRDFIHLQQGSPEGIRLKP